MCRYPALSASYTASSWASLSCQVPNPSAGKDAPVLSLMLVPLYVEAAIFCGCEILARAAVCETRAATRRDAVAVLTVLDVLAILAREMRLDPV